MKTSQAYERGEYIQCATLTRKIIETLAAYHRAKERESKEAK